MTRNIINYNFYILLYINLGLKLKCLKNTIKWLWWGIMDENSLFKIRGLPNYDVGEKREYYSIELKTIINNKILKELIYGIIIQLVEVVDDKIDNLKNVRFDNGDLQYIINLINYPSTIPLMSIPLRIIVYKPTTFCLNVKLCYKGGIIKNGGFSEYITPRKDNYNDKSIVYLEQNLYELNLEDVFVNST